ncbi:MAG: ShlB/FhaC/HecB family hemolysin secretion/activation protein [Synechococcus sp. ELA057]
MPLDPAELQKVLAPCQAIAAPQERLNACAAALTASLVAQGYVNTRVYVSDTAGDGRLEVVPGRIVELRVNSSDPALNRRVQRLLRSLRGQVLNLPDVAQQMQLLRRQPGVANVRANLSRLGSDVSQAVLVINITPGPSPWQGDISVRDDGTNGSGQYRAVATFLKPSVATRGDTLLVYGEVDSSADPNFGSLITSISYTLPITDQINFTGAFGFSRRNLVELQPPLNGFSSSQYQGFGQLEWVFSESLKQRWNLFLAFSENRTNTFVNDQALPGTFPTVISSPTNGYLRFGVAGSGINRSSAWSGNAYVLQGVPAAMPADQRQDIQAFGINPGQATAIGTLISGAWAFAPSWQLNARVGGQYAFNPLFNSMQFTLGSDVGIRGLPGQLVSGDTGVLGTVETVWTFWQKKGQALQLVPFIGAGSVSTSLLGLNFEDSVGAGGVLVRWLGGDNWSAELGWVDQFFTSDNPGFWQNASLGNGVYFKLGYRF